MSIGVSHTFGGTVVIVDMDSDLRFDLTPAMARSAAEQLRETARLKSMVHLMIAAINDRTLMFEGAAEHAVKIADDLETHARRAEAWLPVEQGRPQ